MKTEKKLVRTTKGLKEYTFLGCPLTRSRSAWCYRLCIPDSARNGRCGRIAPHSLKSKIQQGIEDHNKKRQNIHFEKLEHMYLSRIYNQDYNPGIRISEGEAEIIIPLSAKFCDPTGSIQKSVCIKAMEDSTVFAVNSLVDKEFVLIETLNLYLTQIIAKDEIIAKAHFLGTLGDQYLAESVVVDSEGKEISRASSIITKSNFLLSSDPGYN